MGVEELLNDNKRVIGMNDIFINQQCGVIYEGFFWGFNAEENELLKTDIKSGVLAYVTTFEKLSDKDCLFNNIVAYNGKLILIPGNSDYIVTYEIVSGEKKYYEYKDSFSSYVPNQSFLKFVAAETYENFLYLISNKNKYLMIIDMDTMQIKYSTDLFKRKRGLEKDIDFAYSYAKINDTIYVPCIKDHYVFKLNLTDNKMQWIKIDTNLFAEVKCMTGIENKIYILSMDNEMFEWMYETNTCRRIGQFEGDYSAIYSYQDGIFMVPSYRGAFIWFDRGTGIRQYKYDEEFRFSPFWDIDTITHTKVVKTDTGCMVVPRCSNMLIFFEGNTQKLSFIKITISNDEKTKKYLFDKFMGGDNLWNENGVESTLSSLIHLMLERD